MQQPPTRMEVHFGNRLVRCYAGRPGSVRDFLGAALQNAADQPAITDGDETLSYRALDEAAARVARALRHLSVDRRDRVAMIVANRKEFAIVALACAKLAAILVPMGLRLRSPEITYICQDSAAKVLFHEASLADVLPDPASTPDLAHRVSVAGASPGSTGFDALLGHEPLTDEPDLHEDDPYCIFYTSGTTGKPKGGVITHLGTVHSSLHWKFHLDLPERPKAVLAIPASHIAGFAGVLMPILHLQGHLTLVPDFKAAAFLDLVEEKRIEHALLVPAMYNLCLLTPDIGTRDLSSWRWAIYGGAPMPEATIRKFQDLLPGLMMANAYGATETTSPATIMMPKRTLEKPASIGVSVACGDIRIMGEDGKEVAAGETGELFISGPMVIPHYWNNPEATDASFINGYWRSGDLGSIDGEGFVNLFDRKKDMIIRGGYKVFSAEVENALADHGDIIDAAVIGMPDDILGERVAAFIQCARDSLSADEVRAFCASRIADYKVPERLEISTDPLPRNANGKLQKDVLRARLR
ncbi:class I adenylate-forming enzyme family protein [Mesorhizobium sp. CO1-1-8]|uniref:class I adenylate-forming enzyme family protein n=1 Tax=Mesorhizobium sp. CO1-1-8 TaxID=2876631 RepID=UPI001CD09079|nr:AMP-binding protein [Mesorhizobium sp. CO1-1-8]MBZ9772234.1 AMP-binding protein [Mesorhizobium sp. CO1-1-8]